MGLDRMAKLWASPKTPTGGPETRASKQTRGSGGEDLETQARMWATPTTRDLKDSSGQDVPENCLLGRQVQTSMTSGKRSFGDGRKLNPLFDEWLIGWPIGWTCPCPPPATLATGGPSDFARWETASLLSLRLLLRRFFSSATASEIS